MPLCVQGAKYTDRLKYQETQPTHKKGFLTGDFSRRDEFSMTFRTEQYRTLLKQVTPFLFGNVMINTLRYGYGMLGPVSDHT